MRAPSRELYSADRSILGTARLQIAVACADLKRQHCEFDRGHKRGRLPATLVMRRTSAHRFARRAERDRCWLPSESGEQNSTSAFATWPCANGGLLFLRAPAIDHVDAETPFRTYPKTGQLFRAQQSIHGGWMDPQIFGEFPHRKYRGRGGRRARFLRSFFFHAHTLINFCVQKPAPRHSKDG
jgi:hypothetical protein